MVTAGWIMGLTSLMTGLVEQPNVIQRCLDKITTTLINWLHAQLDMLTSHRKASCCWTTSSAWCRWSTTTSSSRPHLQRIFAEFDGLVRIYHNDTPCPHLYPSLAEAGFDIFNFTHEVDIAQTKAAMGHRVALMGNVPPLHIAVRESPEVVAEFAQACLDRGAPGGGMILSVGGGVSPDTPAASIDAMVAAAEGVAVRPSPASQSATGTSCWRATRSATRAGARATASAATAAVELPDFGSRCLQTAGSSQPLHAGPPGQSATSEVSYTAASKITDNTGIASSVEIITMLLASVSSAPIACAMT